MKTISLKKQTIKKPIIKHNTIRSYHNIVIGIITIPHSKKTKLGTSHIMKAYVDWFQSRGVHVLPIPYDTTEPEIYFNQINGLLIPGGETVYIMKQSKFIETVTRFVELSLQKNEYFPIWGTCFGFELLMFLIGGFSKLKRYNAHGLYPIKITEINSRIFGNFSKKYLNYLKNNKSTQQNHEYGISPEDFIVNQHLKRFYNIVATAIDEDGKEYVAAIEAKYYPIYGVQHHPERQKTSGQFADFFISELKKNKHRCKATYLQMDAHKCIQYEEHKNLSCYFF